MESMRTIIGQDRTDSHTPPRSGKEGKVVFPDSETGRKTGSADCTPSLLPVHSSTRVTYTSHPHWTSDHADTQPWAVRNITHILPGPWFPGRERDKGRGGRLAW